MARFRSHKRARADLLAGFDQGQIERRRQRIFRRCAVIRARSRRPDTMAESTASAFLDGASEAAWSADPFIVRGLTNVY